MDLVGTNGLTGCGNLTGLDASIASSRLEIMAITRCISVDNLGLVWTAPGLTILDANIVSLPNLGQNCVLDYPDSLDRLEP